MGFISWLVVGALFMLAEFGVGRFYLLAVGLACAYPAYAAFLDASVAMQLLAFSLGALIHAMIVMGIRKLRPSSASANTPTDAGQRVEVIEWLDEGTARVRHQDKEWEAIKCDADMPDAPFGIIKTVQYGRLVISTEQQPEENT